uniref:hypothetical protein n=1 Tax=Enterocloster clostridioformis TaxID=1531 RepID=UPI001C3D6224|nr:hypothetical protein [Enterocloster clostridioformis]
MFNIQVGAGKAEIRFSPEDFPLKAFTGIHDEIYARVLLLGEENPVALVSIELTSLPAEAVRRFQRVCAEAVGLKENAVFVSVTHTFSAPHIPPHIKSEQEQRLSDLLYHRISTAIRCAAETAAASFAQAQVSYCETSCCLNVNRNVPTEKGYWLGRDEAAYSNHTVRTLKFSRGGSVFAWLINYDIQASVMDKSESAAGGRLISGDLAGAASRTLERTGAEAAVFLPGCAGDQSPVVQAVWTDGTDLHESGFALAERLGQYLAERVEAADASDTGESSGFFVLRETANLPEQEMKYPTKELCPHKQFAFDLTGGHIPVQIVAVRLGPAGLLLTAPELNSGFGGKLRQLLGKKLLIGTLVNGAVKYLPEAEDFERITYQAMNTTLGPGSAKAFLEAVSRLKDKFRAFETGGDVL